MTSDNRVLTELIGFLTGKLTTVRDWRATVAMAGSTLTIGNFAEVALAAGPVALPSQYMELLQDIRKRARERNNRLKQQLAEVLPALNDAGVEPVAMKGMARMLCSRQEQSRLLADIDILVPHDRRDSCENALVRLGYQRMDGGEQGVTPVFGRACDVGTIDLHSSLKPDYIGLGYHSVAPLCAPATLGGGTLLLPNATCQLLLMIIHDQLNDRDYWRGLIDIRHLIDTYWLVLEGVDWTLLGTYFATGTSKRAFQVQMQTAAALLDIEIPSDQLGNGWSRFQLARRRLQMRAPVSRFFFIPLTILIDPPRASIDASARPAPNGGSLSRLRRRAKRYFWVSQPGKIC